MYFKIFKNSFIKKCNCVYSGIVCVSVGAQRPEEGAGALEAGLLTPAADQMHLKDSFTQIFDLGCTKRLQPWSEHLPPELQKGAGRGGPA